MSEESIPPSERGRGERRRGERRGALGPGGWVRRLARLWGFLGFVILVVILARSVLLPFVFALLLAYILAPVVERMSIRSDGRRRMPRALAIVICYIVFLAAVGSFVVVLMPRLYKDAVRIGSELPDLYEQLDEEWAPGLARWIENRFPAATPAHAVDEALAADAGEIPLVADVPVPPGTAFVLTPLPDGRMAVQLQPGGLDLAPRAGGGYHLTADEDLSEELGIEDRIRNLASQALASLQSQVGDFIRFGQALVGGLMRSIFTFFLVLMVAAFLLLDMEKLHGFARSLVPMGYHGDFDVIVAGINRGLSGVIRGQLLICLINGVLTYIGLLIFSVKYSLILAVVAAVMSLIPIFGSILSTIPIVMAALVSGEQGIDVARAVFSVAWIVGIHFVEANMLNPKIIGSSAKIHPVLVIFALIVGEHGYGLVGALLAVPVMSTIQVLFLFFRSKAWRHESGVDGVSGKKRPRPRGTTGSAPDGELEPPPRPVQS